MAGRGVDAALHQIYRMRLAARNTRLQRTGGKTTTRASSAVAGGTTDGDRQDFDSYVPGQSEDLDALAGYFGIDTSATKCPAGGRRLQGGTCAPTGPEGGEEKGEEDEDPEADWMEDVQEDPAQGGRYHREAGHGLPPCVYDEHYHPDREFLGGAGAGRDPDEQPLGFFIYDASQEFHGEVVVF
jgi:hypothetical protein